MYFITKINIISPKQLKTLSVLILLGLSQCETNTHVSHEQPQGMVLIPFGTFIMGGKSDQAERDEFPRNQVSISSFYMDVTEVTNAQFNEFVLTTGYQTVAEKEINWEVMKKQIAVGSPKPPAYLLQSGSLVFHSTTKPVSLDDYSQWWKWTIGADWRHPEGPESTIHDKSEYPVVHIAWEDAVAYAKWAGKRLPSEAEWEWAAMGGQENAKYPWGNEPIETAYSKANFWQGLFPQYNKELDGFFGTAPVKSFPANGYGLYDMAGNVWEWCNDKYHISTYTSMSQMENIVDPKGSETSFDPYEPYAEKYVLRGGSFLCNESYCSGYRVARRMSSTKDAGFSHTGFRCVKDLNAENL